MEGWEEVRSWLHENRVLVITALVTSAAGALLTKVAPWLLRHIGKTVTRIAVRFSKRLAWRSFRGEYLDWVVTQLRELKLTGVVAADQTKKPQLEQVFISLIVSKEEGAPAPPNAYAVTNDRAMKLVDGVVRYVDMALLEQWFTAERPLTRRKDQELVSSLLGKVVGPRGERVDHVRLIGPMTSMSTLELTIRERSGTRFRLLLERPSKRGSFVHMRFAHAVDNLGVPDNPLPRSDNSPVTLNEALRSTNRLAILGPPGAGKTTLLQYVALAHARQKAGDKALRRKDSLRSRFGHDEWLLPIYVPLVSVAPQLSSKTADGKARTLMDVVDSILPPDLQNNAGARGFFARHAERGNCIFLLDGLDEVSAEKDFKAVLRAIDSAANHYKRARFVVTSRIAGWREGLGRDFQRYYVQEMSDAQVDAFVETWYGAVEMNAVAGRLDDEGPGERRARMRRAAAHSTALKVAIRENEGIRRLAANPMLLSIIALVHRNLAVLPRERSKLYKQCSGILLEQWDISKGFRVDDTGLRLEQKEAIIRRLAFEIHSGRLSKGSGQREARRDDVVSLVTTLLPSLGRPADDAPRLVGRLLERSGVLIERRNGIIAFSHHTFQEYFAAQHLATTADARGSEFLLHADRLHSPWWTEVILLYTGLLSDSSAFLSGIWNPQVEENLCRPRLRVATAALAEAVEVSELKVRDTILSEAAELRFGTSLGPGAAQAAEYLMRWARSPEWYTVAASTFAQRCAARAEWTRLWSEIAKGLGAADDLVRQAALNSLQYLPLAATLPESIPPVVG